MQQSQRVCFLHRHIDVAFWEHLIDLIIALPKEVKHIYFEYTDKTNESFVKAIEQLYFEVTRQYTMLIELPN